MDASEVDSVLQAILLGMLVADNSAEDARSSMTILAKLVSNALLHPADPKFQKVNCQNDKIARHICNTPGASEFMDAILFNRVDNEFLLLDSSRLARAEEALKLALGTLPAVAPKRPVAAATTATAPAPSQDNEYELRKREAEQRQAQFAKKQEEERKNKERITLQMRQEQREVQSRPVVASKAVSLSRPAAGNGGGGQVVYANSDREFQALLASKPFVLANFTATWCGPCQQIAPQVEEMARANPHVQVCKVDIDQNQDTPGKFNVTAVPTFILFKNGSVVGEVKGANAQAVQALMARAV